MRGVSSMARLASEVGVGDGGDARHGAASVFLLPRRAGGARELRLVVGGLLLLPDRRSPAPRRFLFQRHGRGSRGPAFKERRCRYPIRLLRGLPSPSDGLAQKVSRDLLQFDTRNSFWEYSSVLGAGSQSDHGATWTSRQDFFNLSMPETKSPLHDSTQALLQPASVRKSDGTLGCLKSFVQKSVFVMAKRLCSFASPNMSQANWESARPKSESPKIGTVRGFSADKSVGRRNGLTENKSCPSDPDFSRDEHDINEGRAKTSAAWIAATAAPHHETGNRYTSILMYDLYLGSQETWSQLASLLNSITAWGSGMVSAALGVHVMARSRNEFMF